MDSKNIRTIEQGRAKFAYEKVQEIKGYAEAKRKEYKSYAKKLPMMIKTNGLGPALAFANSKDAYKLIFSHISSWIKENPRTAQDPNFKELREDKNKDLVAFVIKCDSDVYKMVTLEILAFLNWLRRFAEGLGEEQDA
jgi:CRISPR-associated protein Cmr5